MLTTADMLQAYSRTHARVGANRGCSLTKGVYMKIDRNICDYWFMQRHDRETATDGAKYLSLLVRKLLAAVDCGGDGGSVVL